MSLSYTTPLVSFMPLGLSGLGPGDTSHRVGTRRDGPLLHVHPRVVDKHVQDRMLRLSRRARLPQRRGGERECERGSSTLAER